MGNSCKVVNYSVSYKGSMCRLKTSRVLLSVKCKRSKIAFWRGPFFFSVNIRDTCHARRITRIKDMKNEYKIDGKNMKGTDYMGDLGADERIILKSTLKKEE